jgi:hypothetical protein
MNTITLENYTQFKPSDLIARGVHDMFDAVEAGYEIITYNWFGRNEMTNKCFVCVGGAVLRGMVPHINRLLNDGDADAALHAICINNNRIIYLVAQLFDRIRTYDKSSVIVLIEQLYDINTERHIALHNVIGRHWKGELFYGQLNKPEIEQLSKSIFSLVDALRSVGL